MIAIIIFNYALEERVRDKVRIISGVPIECARRIGLGA